MAATFVENNNITAYKKKHKINEENIPLEAKIIAISDTFSALVTNRPYRNGVKYENAIEIMKKCSGSQLDEEILDVFLNIPIKQIEKCMPVNLQNISYNTNTIVSRDKDITYNKL